MRITEATTTLGSMYFSYEGGRGYTPEDYLKNVIAPRVAVTTLGTSTIGGYSWLLLVSTNSEWYITKAVNDQWLVVVENKKSTHTPMVEILDTFEAN